MTDEAINVGDRVRLKGDQGGAGHGINWLTVTSRVGDIVAVSYWTTAATGAPFLARLDGVERAALTTQLPAETKATPTKRRAR